MLDLERYGAMLEQIKLLVPFEIEESTTSLTEDDEVIAKAKEEMKQKREKLYTDLITFSLSKTIQDVANYTNIPIDELPQELDRTMVTMVVRMIDTHDLLSRVEGTDGTYNIQSLNEGDTSVTFRSKSEIYNALQNINPISDNDINVLNNFRKIKW